MPGRIRLNYDPWEPNSVSALAETLTRATGMEWAGWHAGDVPTIRDAAVLAAFLPDEHGRRVLAGIMLLGEAITAEMLRQVPIAAIENSRNLTEQDVRDKIRKLTPLQDADRSEPDAFSDLVATHYKLWAAAVPHPVAAMAADAHVKPATVHTWVREARLRGLLPRTRRGKAQ